MYEVEMKVRADHDVVRERLEERDASLSGIAFQEDTYYDAPHREFAETDEALRVRREADLGADAPASVDAVASALSDGEFESRVTYKGPLVEAASKTREEFETRVDDGDTMARVFDALGFSPAATVAKRREFWTLSAVTVTVDDVDGLGTFVEAEVESDEDEVDRARERVARTLRDLGLDPEEQIRTSYLGLLLDAADD
ncbi:class IV adenylate cyclase [Halorubellus sp. JP-L1]|uniref:class IV adenylate cyclase n=1 Tax=Halorubellus sp. JP-L1 TaxID=2715753 RepID=UPI001409A127|nr:class IV adenylate cyclase [Halorubellus sp. JP-L1]NHN40300.1 class IV adenylate cyclase [Halorubellus sp. JP-L1]